MARRTRLVIPGLPHHITQRGNNRQNVFFSDQDRLDYIEMLRRHGDGHDLKILGWCLMTNHVHVIAIPGHLQSMALTLGQSHAQYSLQLNRQKKWVGHVWQNRFCSSPLATTHVLTALRYVDLNPVRARMVASACEWRWSSARAHVSAGACDRLLASEWQAWTENARLGAWDFGAWGDMLNDGQLPEDTNEIRRATRLGEPLGSEEFVVDLERRLGRRLRVLPQGRPPRGKICGIQGEQAAFA